MTEEQRAKYQRSLDKMSAEQQAEFINAVEILNRSTSIKIVTIKRQKYYVVTYISCTAMYPKEKLQAFADRLQAANSRSIEDSIAAMQALA